MTIPRSPGWPTRLLSVLALLALAACDLNSAAPTATPIPPAPTATLTLSSPTSVPPTAPPAPSATPATLAPPTLPPPTVPPVTTAATEVTPPPTVTMLPTSPPAVAPPDSPTALPAETPGASATAETAGASPTTAPSAASETPASPDQTAVPSPAVSPPPPATGGDPQRVPGDLSEVSRGLKGKHQVALTFDAGAGRGQPEEILRILAAHHVHITFFLTGQWVEQNPDAAKAIADAGMEIANHSYSHPSFFKISDAEMTTEIDKAETLIHDTTGEIAQPYFRAPFGDTNDHVDSVIRSHGYRDFLWTLDSLDSVGKPKSADFIYNRICNTSWLEMDGAIFLQHMAAPTSVEALPRILDTLAERGWKVVTLTELLTP